ncbi:TlpA family protein disulfide reductase [Salana multivorans]
MRSRGLLGVRRSPLRTARSATAAGLGLVLASGLLAGCSFLSSAGDNPEVADAGYESVDQTLTLFAPAQRTEAVELEGVTFEGELINLADWRGDVVVLNFWYADCPPCRVEAPDLADLARDYADQGVHVLGVNARDDADRVASFNESFDVPYPSLDDSDARAVAALQGVVSLTAYPTTVVLDRQGRPAGRILGIADATTLRGLVDDTLAEAEE